MAGLSDAQVKKVLEKAVRDNLKGEATEVARSLLEKVRRDLEKDTKFTGELKDAISKAILTEVPKRFKAEISDTKRRFEWGLY